MIIKKHTTGFFTIKSENLIILDEKEFISTAYQIALANNLSVRNIDTSLECKSFYFVKLGGTWTTDIYLVVNAYTLYLTFADYIDDGTIRYSDRTLKLPDMNQQYTYIDRLKLESNPEEALEDLEECEIHELNYWKPKTYGEIIFNFWD